MQVSGERPDDLLRRLPRMVDHTASTLIRVPVGRRYPVGIGVEDAQVRPPFTFQSFFEQSGIEGPDGETRNALVVFCDKAGIWAEFPIGSRVYVTHHPAVMIERACIPSDVAGRERDLV